MSSNRAGAFFGGFLVGAAVGAVAGLLVAPRTGRETRQFLRKSANALPELAEDLSTSVQMQADKLSESALKGWDGTLSRLREAIAAGLEASQMESRQISRSGTSSNELSSPAPARAPRESTGPSR